MPKNKCNDCGCTYTNHWDGITEGHGGICGITECRGWTRYPDSQCPDAAAYWDTGDETAELLAQIADIEAGC